MVAAYDFVSDCSFVDEFDKQVYFGVDFALVEYVFDAERPTALMRHPGFLPTYLHVDSQHHCWYYCAIYDHNNLFFYYGCMLSTCRT